MVRSVVGTGVHSSEAQWSAAREVCGRTDCCYISRGGGKSRNIICVLKSSRAREYSLVR